MSSGSKRILDETLSQLLPHPIQSIQRYQTHCYRIHITTNLSYFCKVTFTEQNTTHSTMLEAEYQGLLALHEAHNVIQKQHNSTSSSHLSLSSPAIIAYHQAEHLTLLLTEWFDFVSGTPQQWLQCGQALAHFHNHSHRVHTHHIQSTDQVQQFGYAHDNYIGLSPQSNQRSTSWADFFVQQRLKPQFEMAQQKKITFRQQEQMIDKVYTLLDDHKPVPSLVHGDLWSGNIAISKQGVGVIYDPAVYYGDAEVDLAMSTLFGGMPRSFYEGYQINRPYVSGYQLRCKIYNLYHWINHAHLFGGYYIQQTQKCIDEIINSR